MKGSTKPNRCEASLESAVFKVLSLRTFDNKGRLKKDGRLEEAKSHLFDQSHRKGKLKSAQKSISSRGNRIDIEWHETIELLALDQS